MKSHWMTMWLGNRMDGSWVHAVEGIAQIELGISLSFSQGSFTHVSQLGSGSLVGETVIMMMIMILGYKCQVPALHQAQFHAHSHELPLSIFSATILFSWHSF